MTSGTKIFLAVFAAFVGVLVLYYGVLMPEAQSLPTISAAAGDVQKPASDSNSTEQSHVAPAAIGSTPGAVTPPVTSPTSAVADSNPTGVANPETAKPVLESNPRLATNPQASPSHETNSAADPANDESLLVANHAVSLPLSKNTNSSNGTTATTPAPRVAAASPSTSQSTEYVVKAGDTFSSIASDWFGDSNKWSLIAKENPLVDPARLHVGQKLRLPSKDATLPTVKEQATQTATGGQPLYTVRSGDTLAKIAREYYNDVAKWKAIYEANRSAIGSDPANLKAGMKLKLPPPSKPASS